MLKIGLIVGSTRPNRFADVPARWIEDGAARRVPRRAAAGQVARRLGPSRHARRALFDNLVWWADALKDARTEPALAA
jgi:NAD(P)H-dependent FMN reductase